MSVCAYISSVTHPYLSQKDFFNPFLHLQIDLVDLRDTSISGK
jgi:hypothetical protein